MSPGNNLFVLHPYNFVTGRMLCNWNLIKCKHLWLYCSYVLYSCFVSISLSLRTIQIGACIISLFSFFLIFIFLSWVVFHSVDVWEPETVKSASQNVCSLSYLCQQWIQSFSCSVSSPVSTCALSTDCMQETMLVLKNRCKFDVNMYLRLHER